MRNRSGNTMERKGDATISCSPQVIDPDHNTTTMAFDADGQVTQTISPTSVVPLVGEMVCVTWPSASKAIVVVLWSGSMTCGEQEIVASPFRSMVLPDLFRIQPFVGLAQPIPLKPTPKPSHRLMGVE